MHASDLPGVYHAGSIAGGSNQMSNCPKLPARGASSKVEWHLVQHLMEWNQGRKGTGIGIQLYSDFLRIGQVSFLFKIRDETTLREFDSSARRRQQRRRLLRRDRTSASAMNCADRSPPSWEASATARWSTPSRQHRKTRLWYAYSISLLLSPLTIRSCPYYFNPYMLK